MLPSETLNSLTDKLRVDDGGEGIVDPDLRSTFGDLSGQTTIPKLAHNCVTVDPTEVSMSIGSEPVPFKIWRKFTELQPETLAPKLSSASFLDHHLEKKILMIAIRIMVMVMVMVIIIIETSIYFLYFKGE